MADEGVPKGEPKTLPSSVGRAPGHHDEQVAQDHYFAAERAAELAEARVVEAPLLRDLSAVGVQVPTVWDLYLYPNAYPAAIPVLIRHIAKDYPLATLGGIGSALRDRSARPWWKDLKNMYLTDEREAVRDRLAPVLAGIAVKEHYEELVSLLTSTHLGESRIHFVRPVNRIGNRSSPGRGRAAIAPFANDPVLGAEVTAVMKGRGRDS